MTEQLTSDEPSNLSDATAMETTTPSSGSGQHQLKLVLTRKPKANKESLLLVLPGADVYFGPGAAIRDIKKIPRWASPVTTKSSHTFDWTKVTKHDEDFISGHPGKDIGDSGKEPHEAPTCAVCWCEPENDTYTTACGHTYCSSCFANQCLSVNADTVPIRCLGAGGECQRIFGLPELRTALGLQAFEKLLEAALDAHIKGKPEEFRYCPMADCLNVYRVSKKGDTVKCITCRTLLCATCHTVSHENKTCQANQAQLQGDNDFLEWKQQNKAKDCPKCGSTIQKTEGCNHIQCMVCNTQMCFVCLTTVGSLRECYAHMQAVHGSFVDPEDDAMREFEEQAQRVDPRLMEQLQHGRGDLIHIEAEEQEHLFGIVNQADDVPDLGVEDRLRIEFALAASPLEEDNVIRIPPRIRQRVVEEPRPELAPLEPAMMLEMLRHRRDNHIYQHLQQLDPLDADAMLVNLDQAVGMLLDGATDARAAAMRAQPGLRSANPEFDIPLAEAIQGNADWARSRGGQRLDIILERRIQRMNQGLSLVPPSLNDLLGVIFFRRENYIVQEVRQLATAAPQELENFFQALDEAFNVAARDETDEDMEVPVGASLGLTDVHRINPEDQGGRELIQRIARVAALRFDERNGRLQRLPAHKLLSVLRLSRHVEIEQARHDEFFRDIRRRIRQPEPIAALHPLELLILIRRGGQNLIEEHNNRLLQLPDQLQAIRMQGNLAQANTLRMREVRSLRVHQVIDGRVDELVARRESEARVDELAARLASWT